MNASLKKNILIGITCVAGITLLAALGWFLWFNAQFRLYQDKQYQFAIKFPKTWKVVVHPRKGVAVVFMRPKDTALDVLQENFNVTIQSVPMRLLSLPDFTAKAKAQMLAVFKKNIRVAREQSVHWGWREGHEVVFEAPVPDHLILVTAWVLKEDQVYILTFLGDMNKYPQDAKRVDTMIRSLELQ